MDHEISVEYTLGKSDFNLRSRIIHSPFSSLLGQLFSSMFRIRFNRPYYQLCCHGTASCRIVRTWKPFPLDFLLGFWYFLPPIDNYQTPNCSYQTKYRVVSIIDTNHWYAPIKFRVDKSHRRLQLTRNESASTTKQFYSHCG